MSTLTELAFTQLSRPSTDRTSAVLNLGCASTSLPSHTAKRATCNKCAVVLGALVLTKQTRAWKSRSYKRLQGTKVEAPAENKDPSIKEIAGNGVKGDEPAITQMSDLNPSEREAAVQSVIDSLSMNAAAMGKDVLVRRGNQRAEDEEAKLQREAKEYLESEGFDTSEMKLDIIEINEKTMGDDPEVKYRNDKTLLMETFDRGDIQLLETSCAALLARHPEDTEVWQVLTRSRLRLKLWDAALESARRWIAFEPRALNPRCAEAFALAGSQQDDYLGEARARFAQLAKEVTALGEVGAEAAAELQECVWRVEELQNHRTQVRASRAEGDQSCLLSARPATVITGARPSHFFLPSFADAVGPVKVQFCESLEYGGGQSHHRKIVVTEDVQAGDLLFVQSPLVFGLVEQPEQMERLSEALVTAATSSAHAAARLDLMLDDKPLEDDSNIVEKLFDPQFTRPLPWSKDPETMIEHLKTCEQLMERSKVFTGRGYCGLWPMMAMARHSCAPTANATFWGDILVARASRKLKAGDEVTFTFFEVYGQVELRQQAAMKNGGFVCRCPRCEVQASIDPRADAAADKLRAKFVANYSRINGIKEELTFKMEAKQKEFERRYECLRNPDEQRKFEQGLSGLADRFREMNGRQVTDEDISALQDYMPEMNEPAMVKVPKKLQDELLTAVLDFESEIRSLGLSEQVANWQICDQLIYYGETLVLLRLGSDLPAQRRLVESLLPAIAETVPGCFEHQRFAVFLWEVAVQCEDPTLSQLDPTRELVPNERAKVRECLRIRYGRDLSPMEEDAAMARTSCSRSELDENWMWEITWCIGRYPPTEAGRGPGGRVNPFFGPIVLC